MFDWTARLRPLYDKAVAQYRAGQRGEDTFFTPAEREFLAAIGLKPINVYDYAEDFVSAGEPDWETFLLVAAARRDYFLYEQNCETCTQEISGDELPAREAELGGIAWLPRIIAKARCFLGGGLCHDIMYGCGGDRRFLRTHDLHAADFLRAVWSSRGDDGKVLAFVQKNGR